MTPTYMFVELFLEKIYENISEEVRTSKSAK
jgi:hypothetical protein